MKLTREERLEKCNKFLKKIGNDTGFLNATYFEVDSRSRIWLHDRGEVIWMYHHSWYDKCQQGHRLKMLIKHLFNYIRADIHLSAGHIVFRSDVLDQDMTDVVTYGIELGVIKENKK